MKLSEQIQQLERRQREEWRKAEYLFARTKRDIRRKLSPERIIRKHVGFSMAAAAIGSLLLARGIGSGRSGRGQPAAEKSSGAPGWLGMLGRVFSKKLRHVSGHNGVDGKAAAPEHAPPKRERSLMEVAMVELLTAAARRVNWTALLQRVTERFRHDGRPAVGVSDGGTRRSDEGLGEL